MAGRDITRVNLVAGEDSTSVLPDACGMEPTWYRIVVRGRFGEPFASALGGVAVESAAAETALVGEFTDQAQLHGLVERLRDFGIELVSINPVE